MSVWTVIKNLRTIISFFGVLKELIVKVSQGKRLPDCQETHELLQAVENLLDSGVIDIPGVDEKQISAALKEIESQWTCKI
jgi:hypothetical protein